MRKYFSRRADALGYTERFIGLREKAHLADFLRTQDCREVSFDTTDLTWKKKIAYGEALDQFRERLFAEFWYLLSGLTSVYLQTHRVGSRGNQEDGRGSST